MTLAQQNATLLQVNGAGSTPDWDSPDSAGLEKWKGQLPAYYNEKRGVELVAEGRNIVMRRRLIVEAGRPAIQFEEDDVVRFSLKRRRGSGGGLEVVQLTAKVETVEERDAPSLGIPGTVRLTFAPE